jgi:hypothetical protein
MLIHADIAPGTDFRRSNKLTTKAATLLHETRSFEWLIPFRRRITRLILVREPCWSHDDVVHPGCFNAVDNPMEL